MSADAAAIVYHLRDFEQFRFRRGDPELLMREKAFKGLARLARGGAKRKRVAKW